MGGGALLWDGTLVEVALLVGVTHCGESHFAMVSGETGEKRKQNFFDQFLNFRCSTYDFCWIYISIFSSVYMHLRMTGKQHKRDRSNEISSLSLFLVTFVLETKICPFAENSFLLSDNRRRLI